MQETSYHLSLKGYVGGWDFNRNDVDKTLAENEGKPVNVLIDSLGSSPPSSPASTSILPTASTANGK